MGTKMLISKHELKSQGRVTALKAAAFIKMLNRRMTPTAVQDSKKGLHFELSGAIVAAKEMVCSSDSRVLTTDWKELLTTLERIQG